MIRKISELSQAEKEACLLFKEDFNYNKSPYTLEIISSPDKLNRTDTEFSIYASIAIYKLNSVEPEILGDIVYHSLFERALQKQEMFNAWVEISQNFEKFIDGKITG